MQPAPLNEPSAALPPVMGVTVWLRKNKLLVTGAVYTTARFVMERDLSAATGLLAWSKLDDEALGAVVRHRLESCRRVAAFDPLPSPREEVVRFDAKLAALFGLSSSKGLFPGMTQVMVTRKPPSLFEFSPLKHRGGGYFHEFSDLWPDKQPFNIRQDATDEEIGAATRLAMSKSI